MSGLMWGGPPSTMRTTTTSVFSSLRLRLLNVVYAFWVLGEVESSRLAATIRELFEADV